VTLVTLALAIALGWALFQVAEGAGALITLLLQEYPDGEGRFSVYLEEPLTWFIGDRALTLGPLVRGVVELAIVLLVAAFVRARYHRHEGQPPSTTPV
jgi:hypothetical protein